MLSATPVIVMWEAEMLTMKGGGGRRLFILGGGVGSFLRGSNSSLNKFKRSQSGLKTVTTRGSCKKIVVGGGWGKTKNSPTPYGERDPPHGENGPHVERKDCSHRKNAPIGEKSPS